MLVEQVYVFGWSMVVGVMIGILFDIFRGIRWEGMKDIWVYIQDVIFWIITALIIVVSTFLMNQGEIRGYMIIGFLLGAGFYFLLFSKFLLGGFKWINRKIRGMFHAIQKKIKEKTIEAKQEN